MATLDEDLEQAIDHISNARGLLDAKVMKFYDACEDYDWEKAEILRLEVVAHLESILDGTAAAFKRLEVFRAQR